MTPWIQSTTERGLVKAGFHPSGQWWVDLFDRYEQEQPRSVIVRGGRRMGKTVHVCRKLVDEAVSKEWRVDPGDVGILAVVSARKPQAEDRIATITKYVEALGLEVIRKNNSRIDFQCSWGVCSARAYSATMGDVVSGTWVGALLDEVARWIDDRGMNPATEVIASAKPSLLSTGGTLWMVSSPLSTDDAHAKAFARGDGAGQMVAHAPTWVGAAELYTEQDCRELEPDEILFRREYAAIPTASSGMYWLPAQLLEQAQFEPFSAPLTKGAGGDLAFLHDAAAIAVAGRDTLGMVAPILLRQWLSDEAVISPTHTLLEASLLLRASGVESVITDRHARAHMREAANAHGLGYRFAPDNGSHLALLRRLLLSRSLALPRCNGRCVCLDGRTCDALVRQLQRMRVHVEGDRVRASHPYRDGAHGDLAEAFALAAWAIATTSSGATLGAPAALSRRLA